MRISPRWRKVIRDIFANKARTALVVLAIAVGVFAFGSVFITQTVLLADMNTGFASSNPANIIVQMNEPFDESLLRTVRTIEEVDDVEARISATLNVWDGNGWRNLTLIAVPDIEELTIGEVTLQDDAYRTFPIVGPYIDVEGGTLNLGRREVLIERNSLTPLGGPGIGDTITVELNDGSTRDLHIGGIVHDFNAAPGFIAPFLTGYVNIDTLRQFGLTTNYNELHIIATSEYDTREELEELADDLEVTLDRYGYSPGFAQVQLPTEHWASDLVNALTAVLGAIGFLALGLSGLLVFNTVTAILSQQKRQVGMMKAIGARGRDILAIYSVMSMTFGVLSLLVAFPMGIGVSLLLTYILGFLLNVNVENYHVPLFVIGLQLATAIIIPLIAAAIPIFMGTRVTVREAVSDYGIGTNPEGKGIFNWFSRTFDNVMNGILSLFRGLPRPTMLSLRNTFRRKIRLVLTLITLSLAGSIFISVLDVRGSMLGEFDNILKLFGYDVAFFVSEPQPVSRFEREAMRVDEVERVEGWGFANGLFIREDGSEGESFTVLAPPADTPFIDADIIEGRWLEPNDTNVLVMSSEWMKLEPDVELGDVITVDFGQVTRRMEIVGVVNLVGITFAYGDFNYITQTQGAAGLSFAAMMGLEPQPISPLQQALGITPSELAYQTEISRELEEQFKANGMQVLFTQITAQLIGLLQSSVNVLIGFMLFMAFLLAVVGGLGLASTMSLNVLERTREIGVMRAIGASDKGVRNVFLTEGLLIGFISWILSSILSVPIATAFAVVVGENFFERPMDFTFVPMALVYWFIIVMVISFFASTLPARRAAQVSVHESLSYE